MPPASSGSGSGSGSGSDSSSEIPEGIPVEQPKKRRRNFAASASQIHGMMRALEPPPRRRGKGKVSREEKALPPEAALLLGDANMCYVSQEYVEAIRKLEAVVKLAPMVADPYTTLGLVYEAMGNDAKALTSYIAAANLQGDGETWKRVASMSAEQGLLEQAQQCIDKAMRLVPRDASALLLKLQILLRRQQPAARLLTAYRSLTAATRADYGTAISLAVQFRENGHADLAVQVLETCVAGSAAAPAAAAPAAAQKRQRTMSARSEERVDALYGDAAEDEGDEPPPVALSANELDRMAMCNKIAELHMSLEGYAAAVSAIDKIRGARRALDLPAEISVKYGICLAHLGKLELAEPHFRKLTSEPAAQHGHLYYLLAGQFLALNAPSRALATYRALVEHGEGYDVPDVWFKMACCLRAAEHTEATALLRRVLEAAPSHSGAAIRLSEILSKQEQPEASRQVLISAAESCGPQALSAAQTPKEGLRLLISHGQILWALGDSAKFCSAMLPLVQGALRLTAHTEGTVVDAYPQLDGLRLDKAFSSELTSSELYDLCWRLCRGLSNSGRGKAASAIITALTKGRGHCLKLEQDQVTAISTMAFGSAAGGSDVGALLRSMRAVCTAKPHSVPLWNAFVELSVQVGQFDKCRKHVSKLLLKNPAAVPLLVIMGHHCLLMENNDLALGFYLRAHREAPEQPAVCLFAGVTYLSKSMHESAANRHELALRAFAFLSKYRSLQGRGGHGEHEAQYNMARGFHQLGLVHLAVPLYEAALATGGRLQPQAAFNLSALYASGGEQALAAAVADKWMRF